MNNNINNTNNTGNIEIESKYIKKTLKSKDAGSDSDFNSDVLQINIKYPEVKGCKKINAFYDSAAKKFERFCEKDLYRSASSAFSASKESKEKEEKNGSFKPFGAVMTFDAAYTGSDLLCIYLDVNIYSGKGRGNATRKAHIWNPSGGELLSPGRFIKPGRRLKYKICGHISGIMEQQIKDGKEYYINSDIASVYKYLDMKNFYLIESGYSFFFGQNTVAPFNSGIVSFVVPERILSAAD